MLLRFMSSSKSAMASSRLVRRDPKCFQFVSWWLQEQELLRQQQRQCQHLVRMRRGISQQQENVNGVKTNQRSDKLKYCRPIGRGMQRDAHVCQMSNKVKYGRAIGWGMQRGVHVCQRSNAVKYGRPIRRGMQRGAHVCQMSNEVKNGRPIGWGCRGACMSVRGATCREACTS